MNVIGILVQLIIALGIINVWIIRPNRSTRWRGGDASSIHEEFEIYGLPSWFVPLIGTLKVGLAVLLIAGIWYPTFTNIAAAGIAVLMLGAVAMHVKVQDSFRKSVPALSLFAASVFVILI